jgi:hypothetical protein
MTSVGIGKENGDLNSLESRNMSGMAQTISQHSSVNISPIAEHSCSIMHSFYNCMDCTAWWSSAPGLTTHSQVSDQHMCGKEARADVFRPQESTGKVHKVLVWTLFELTSLASLVS